MGAKLTFNRFWIVFIFCLEMCSLLVILFNGRGVSMNQKNSTPVAAILLLFAINAFAESSFEYADVIASVPIYEIVQMSTPSEQCWEEEIVVDRYSQQRHTRTPLLVSTIIGGAIGNAVGHNKSNQRAGAVLGAILGHSIGRDILRNKSQPDLIEYETVRRCSVVYEHREEEKLIGYQVTYLFDGKEYSMRTNFQPGEQIQVRVSVQPVL